LTKRAKNQTLVTSWGRFVLGAFVFAWLNVAAQPCLMALEMGASADLMPMHAEAGSPHVDHDADHGTGAENDCGHCSPSSAGAHQSTCATMQASDCTDLPDSNVDGRSIKLQLKDVPGTFAVSQAPPQVISIRPVSSMAPHSCTRLRFTDSPPLNLRYCVFLK